MTMTAATTDTRDALIVAGLQLDIAWEQPEENFRRAAALASRAAAAGARLLVLPEMFATGFTMNAGKAAAHAAATLEALCGIARQHRVWVVAGLAVPGDERPLNACVLVDPQGREVLRYHKVHSFTLADEHEHFAAGEAVATAVVDGARVTPVICYDLRFPELFRATAADTDLFVVIANWPVKRGHAWRSLLTARAIDCQAWVLGVNRVGDAEDVHHSGDSALVDPMGITVAAAAEQETVLVGAVDPAHVRSVRSHYTFLADARPEVYARLAQAGGEPSET